jgi:hypothetical protein
LVSIYYIVPNNLKIFIMPVTNLSVENGQEKRKEGEKGEEEKGV